ncbi:TetR/AcrR family transcriptional regulator [Mycetocola tolaasinivorans]|uniref:TetR/AcrR family transcriptional regulator n=1 Tax=Mycetocola tolaasinivorans TaxID=76635 RepID=A0A3L7A7U9_9MICO|nr:TetR family transcriptional regulator [Mycetocola tolaasinivorans]RLP76456.1 TetR/AcrR family transcriptional regulator [Mycetocola tolaasinivorans]
MQRDAEATQARLLAAARAEFAEHGIAGARIDRIAAQAKSNKAQIYHYFGSKDQLFEAVFAQIGREVVEGVPINVDDLPAYAAALALGNDAHPEIMRLATWQRLERGGQPLLGVALESNRAKIAAIAKAQADGLISTRHSAEVTLALVIHMSGFWATMQPELNSIVGPQSPEERGEVVRQAVADLLRP